MIVEEDSMPTTTAQFDTTTIAARSYWGTVLSKPIGRSNLPFDHGQAATIPAKDSVRTSSAASSEGANFIVTRFAIDGPLYNSIQGISKGGPFLIYTIFTAGIHLCLHRYNQVDTIVTGSPARNYEDMDVCNALPIVGEIANELSFKSLLLSTRSQLLDAYKNQSYSWLQMADDFSLTSSQGCPLFDLAIRYDALHNHLPDQINSDVLVSIEEQDDTLALEIRWCSDKFGKERISLFVSHLCLLLQSALDAPEDPIRDLPLCGSRDIALYEKANDTHIDYSLNDSVLGRLSSAVSSHSQNIALETPSQVLSYKTLDYQSDQLAQHLIGSGLKLNQIVGIYSRPGCEMVIAIIAIMKAGGTFLPLDPDYPSERIEFMLCDSGCEFLLCDNHELLSETGFSVSDDITTIFLHAESQWRQCTFKALGNANLNQPDNSAYMIYTSGSTGVAKGVLLHYRGLLNLIDAQVAAFDITHKSRLLQFAAFSFDAAISEIFTTLCAGACLVLAPRDHIMPGPVLADVLVTLRISHITLTPSSLSLLPAMAYPDLKTLVVAGEPCPSELVKDWSKYVKMINAYGPTEATVCTTLGEVSYNGLPPDIGQPISNTECHILNSQLQRCAVGEPGELYISGVGLAIGYHNRDELNEARFIDLSFDGGVNSLTCYKSGDIARWRPDGRLDLLGRTDRQVKVRGFRIETGEIENVLLQYPSISQAAVITQGDVSNRRLIAYISATASQQELDMQAINQFLARKVPPHLIPDLLQQIDGVPLSSAGKTDYLELGKLQTASTNHDFVPPRDTTELALVHIWEQLLERSPIGVTDVFFDLGGYSLLAVKLMSSIKDKFHVSLPLNSLFMHPTIEKLAETICAINEGKTESSSILVPITSVGALPPLFCIHPAGATVLCYYHLAEKLKALASTDAQRPFVGIQAYGLDEGQEPFDDIIDMTAYYADELCLYQPVGPFYLAGWSFGGVAAYELSRQLVMRDREVAFLGILDSYSPDVFGGKYHEHDDADIISALLGGIADIDPDSIRGKTLEEQLVIALKATQEAKALPAGLSLKQANTILSITKHNYSAVESYDPQPFDGRITLIRAADEKDFAATISPDDPTLGWSKWAKDISVNFVTGGHQTMVLPPNNIELAEILLTNMSPQ